MRIRYQSFIDPEEDPQYTSLLQSYLDSLAGPDVSYEVVGMVPPDKKLHRISEYRCGAHVIRGAVRARDDGFDAYAIGHFQDGGLGEARSAVDLPVTGLGEASLLFGCSLGRKIGLITINPLFIPWHEEQVAAYGLRERVGRGADAPDDPLDLHGRVHRRRRAQAAARRLQGRVGPARGAGV